MKVTPCYVTYKQLEPAVLTDRRFYVAADGTVRAQLHSPLQGEYYSEPLPPIHAQLVRTEASRQRRNRNARERNEVMRDLGLRRTPYGWE